MRLLVDGHLIDISQMGPNFLIVRSGINAPPCIATLMLRVDQSERQWDVYLPDGISVGLERVAIEFPKGTPPKSPTSQP
jgi:hypothetical protein